MQQEKRSGRGTSSQAFRIMAENKDGTPSSAFYTYAEETAIEKLIERPIKAEVTAKAVKWGSLMECIVFETWPVVDDYELCHKLTIEHKKYPHIWSGTPDMLSPTKVAEVKSYWIKEFIRYSLALKSKDIERIKKDFPQPYWQVVSNAVLAKRNTAELIAFLPTKTQLMSVFNLIKNTDYLQDYKLPEHDYWNFTVERIEEYPYLPDNCNIPSVASFEFEVPLIDKIKLTKKYIEFDKEVKRVLATFKQ